MLESKGKILVTSVRKLHKRGAWRNIKRILDKTHIPDVGLLLEELDKSEKLSIFQLISSAENKANVLSYVEAKTQKDILESIDKSEAKKLVSLMETDDAADLLGSLPKELADEILSSMLKEDSAEVADLMRYPEDSAGGLMSTDFLAFDQNLNVAEAIKLIQEQDDETLVTFYVYVVDENENLVGILSLKDLILSKPSQLLKNIMTTELITAKLDTDQEEVAKIVEHYDFLSLPVVDSNNKLEGIITVDDVIDVIREENAEDLKALGRIGGEDESFIGQLRGRLPWLVFSFFGGVLAFILVRALGAKSGNGEWVHLAGVIPLLLSMGAIMASQSTVSTLSLIGDGGLEVGAGKHVLSEILLSLFFAVGFGVSAYWIFEHVFEVGSLAFAISGSLSFLLVITSVLGSSIPLLLEKINFDPTISSVPLITVMVDLIGLILLLGWRGF